MNLKLQNQIIKIRINRYRSKNYELILCFETTQQCKAHFSASQYHGMHI